MGKGGGEWGALRTGLRSVGDILSSFWSLWSGPSSFLCSPRLRGGGLAVPHGKDNATLCQVPALAHASLAHVSQAVVAGGQASFVQPRAGLAGPRSRSGEGCTECPGEGRAGRWQRDSLGEGILLFFTPSLGLCPVFQTPLVHSASVQGSLRDSGRFTRMLVS